MLPVLKGVIEFAPIGNYGGEYLPLSLIKLQAGVLHWSHAAPRSGESFALAERIRKGQGTERPGFDRLIVLRLRDDVAFPGATLYEALFFIACIACLGE